MLKKLANFIVGENDFIYQLAQKQIARGNSENLQKRIAKIAAQTYTNIGSGYKLGEVSKDKTGKIKGKNLRQINIDNSSRKAHIFIFGSTRVGKTRLAEHMLIQDILAGRNVVFIDPKGDSDIFETMFYYSLLAGREKEFLYLNTITPKDSIQINPTAYYFAYEELVEHIMASVPADDAFFYGVAKELTTLIVRYLVMWKAYTHDESKITFKEVSKLASYQAIVGGKDGKGIIRQNLDILKQEAKFKDEAASLEIIVSRLSSQDPLYFSKVSNTINVALTLMTSGNVGQCLGNAERNDFIERLLKGERVIMLVQTGTLIVGEVASLVGKEVLSMIISHAGRLFASGKKFDPPLCLYGDEFQNLVFAGCEKAFDKGGGAELWITALTQSIASMENAVGREASAMMIANTNTKIIMRLPDEKSAKTFSEYGGTFSKQSAILSAGDNGNLAGREVDDLLVKPEDLNQLQRREFYYFGFEGKYLGKSANVSKTPCEITNADITNIL